VDNELEVIRDEMEQTRANLAEKLGALESQVRETVSGASEAVSSTVAGVKGVVSTVSETVESVTETFNVSKQVEQHPWMAMGAAVATGFVIAQVLGRSDGKAAAPPARELPPQPVAGTAAVAAPRQAEQPAEPKKESGLWHSLESMLPGVMSTMVGSLGELAVGSLMGVIRELASHGLPKEWHGDMTRLIDQVTTQLGGKPLDAARSGQLYHALGLAGEGTQGRHDGSRPSEPSSQQGVQSGPPPTSGARGVTGTGRPPTQRL